MYGGYNGNPIRISDGQIRFNTDTEKLEYSEDAGLTWKSFEAAGGGSLVKVNTTTLATADFTDGDIEFDVTGSTITAQLSTAEQTKVDNGQQAFVTNEIDGAGTGFKDFAVSPTLKNVIVSYNSTTRKVTLSGTTWKAYWRGEEITALTNGWESEAHGEADGSYFLYYDGTDFIWASAFPNFDNVQIHMVFRNSLTLSLREPHGLMPHLSHDAEHHTIGTYVREPITIDNYTLNSTTATDRRPQLGTIDIYDEDLPSGLPALTTNAYTWGYLTGANTFNISNDNTEIISLNGNVPYYNQFTGGEWVQTELTNNQYQKIFIMGLPVTADAESQKNRFILIQGQTASTTLSVIQGLTPNSVQLGQITGALPEYVFVGEIIIRLQGGNWTITSISSYTGNRFSQTSSPSGSFLSSVSTDDTLTGNGTGSSPLGLADAQRTRTIFGNTFTEADEYVLFKLPTAFTISSWTISAIDDSNQSAVFDILVGDTASITSASSITASAKPTMTTAKSATGSTLTGWTTTIEAGKFVFIKLESITGDGVNLQVGGTV